MEMFDQYEEDEFEFIYNILDSEENAERKQGKSRSGRARNVDRDRTAGAVKLQPGYLDANPTYCNIYFKRPFCISQDRFMDIWNKIEQINYFFQTNKYVTGLVSFNVHKKRHQHYDF